MDCVAKDLFPVNVALDGGDPFNVIQSLHETAQQPNQPKCIIESGICIQEQTPICGNISVTEPWSWSELTYLQVLYRDENLG